MDLSVPIPNHCKQQSPLSQANYLSGNNGGTDPDDSLLFWKKSESVYAKLIPAVSSPFQPQVLL